MCDTETNYSCPNCVYYNYKIAGCGIGLTKIKTDEEKEDELVQLPVQEERDGAGE